MIQLTDQPIDTARVLAAVADPNAGANLLFVGTTREFTGPVQTARLDYAAYDAMAEKQLHALATAAAQRWPIIHAAIVHRTGSVAVGEPSVVVAVSAAHRDAAFAAGRWLIDELKKAVPIWKKEIGSDGSGHWVAGANQPSVAPPGVD